MLRKDKSSFTILSLDQWLAGNKCYIYIAFFINIIKSNKMENLIKMVSEKTGISEVQAKSAVETVLTFLKDKMPGGVGGQVESFIKGGAGSLGGIAGNLKDKVGGVFGK